MWPRMSQAAMRVTAFVMLIFAAGSTPNPCIAGELEVVASLSTGVGYCIHSDGRYVYMTNNEGLVIASLEDPAIVGRFDGGGGFGVTTSGRIAFAASRQRICVLDVSNPGEILELAGYDLGATPRRMCTVDDLLFTTSEAGMDIFRFDESGGLKHLSHHEHPQARTVAVIDHTVFLGSYNAGIEILDIEDLSAPRSIGRLAEAMGAWDFQLLDDRLYVGRHGAGLSIFNISSPRAPSLIGEFHDDDGGEVQGVFADGGYLYVADNYGIEVLSLEDPAHPVQVAEFPDVSAAHDIVVAGGLVFAATGTRELLVLRWRAN